MGGALLIVLGFYVIWETVSIFTDYGEGTAEEISCAGDLSECAKSDDDRHMERADRGVDPIPICRVVGVVPCVLYSVYAFDSPVGRKGFRKTLR